MGGLYTCRGTACCAPTSLEGIKGMGVYLTNPHLINLGISPFFSTYTFQLTDSRLSESTMAGKMPALHGKHFVFV